MRPRPRAGSGPQICDAPSIPRARWCAGRCAARGRPERLESFGTIILVLSRPLQLSPSTNQVLLTPLARPAHPTCSLSTGCTPRVAGGYLTRPWKLFSTAAKRQRSAATWRGAGARAAHHAHASGLRRWPGGPHSRSGRQLVVEPADPRCLTGSPGPSAELGGLWSPWVSSRVRV